VVSGRWPLVVLLSARYTAQDGAAYRQKYENYLFRMGGRGSEIGEPKDMAHLASQDLTVDCSLCNFPQCVPVCATRLIKKELHKKFQLQTKTF